MCVVLGHFGCTGLIYLFVTAVKLHLHIFFSHNQTFPSRQLVKTAAETKYHWCIKLKDCYFKHLFTVWSFIMTSKGLLYSACTTNRKI